MSTEQRRRGRTPRWTRVTTRYPKPLLARVEALVDAGVYPNRSEALRNLVETGLDDHED